MADEILGGILTDSSPEKLQKAAVMLEGKSDEVLDEITDEQRESLISSVIGEGKVKAETEKGVKFKMSPPEEEGETPKVKKAIKKKEAVKETTYVGNLGVNLAGSKSVDVTPKKAKKAKLKRTPKGSFDRDDDVSAEGQGSDSPWAKESNPYYNTSKWGEGKSIFDDFVNSVLEENTKRKLRPKAVIKRVK